MSDRHGSLGHNRHRTTQTTGRATGNRITLPDPAGRAGLYETVAVRDGIAHCSGQVAVWNGAHLHGGKVGVEVTLDDAIDSARIAALNVVAQLQAKLGDLDAVLSCQKLTVFVASASGFREQPKVADGASQVMLDIFGDAGRHARSAVGVAELPFNSSVEVEAVFRIAR